MLPLLKENWQDCPYPSRLIGVDQGDKTLGIAMCDSAQSIATPLETIYRGGKSKAHAALRAGKTGSKNNPAKNNPNAKGKKTNSKKSFADDRDALAKIIKDYDVKGMIFGLPLSMDGSEGARCQSVRDTIAALQEHAPFDSLWFGLWDERFSTSVMDRFLIQEVDLNRKRRGEVIDKMAAQHILQGALDFMLVQRNIDKNL